MPHMGTATTRPMHRQLEGKMETALALVSMAGGALLATKSAMVGPQILALAMVDAPLAVRAMVSALVSMATSA